MISNFENFEAFSAHIDTLGFSTKESWLVGGIGGGSCWSEGGHYALTAEEEPEDEALDAILSMFCPTLTFLQYRCLTKIENLYLRENKTYYEYYGNYTEYTTRELNLRVVYDFLVNIENGS